jgi:hypothetical protein
VHTILVLCAGSVIGNTFQKTPKIFSHLFTLRLRRKTYFGSSRGTARRAPTTRVSDFNILPLLMATQSHDI